MNTRMALQSRSEHTLNPDFAYNNPNYGSLDDLRQDIFKSQQVTPLLTSRPNVLSATAQLENIQRLLKIKKPSLPPSTPQSGSKQLAAPRRPPPPPPRTAPCLPPRLHRKHQPHIYENVPLVGHYYNSEIQHDAARFISNVSAASSSSSASSNATVIVRKSPNHLSSTIINDSSMNDLIDECLVQIESDPMFQFTPRMLSQNSLEKTIRAATQNSSNSHSNKKVLSLSPIMTSSRSDLKPPVSELKKSLFPETQGIKQRRPLHQINNNSPSNQRAHMANNFNYFLQEDLKTIRRPLSPQENTGSINSLLLLQPPSPFKSDEESSFEEIQNGIKVNVIESKLNSIHSILSSNKKPNHANKRVSFMLGNNNNEIELCHEPLMALEEIIQSDSISPKTDHSDIECNSSSVSSESASISIPSPTQDHDFDERPAGNLSHLSPSKNMLCCTSPCLKQMEEDAHRQQARHDQLDLFKERFFAKIFSNDGYFFSNGKEAGIESASATSIQSSCSSSSSTSSGYKSNQSNSLHMMSTCSKVPASELDCFIESNWDRLARLKVKRSQLVSTIISQADIIEINRANSNGHVDENGSTIDSLGSNGSNCSRMSEQEDSYDESSSCHINVKNADGHNSSGNSSLDTMIIKTESARMYHKFFENSQADCKVTTRRAVF